MFTIYILDNDKVVKETSQKRSNTTQNSGALIFDCRKSLEKKNTLTYMLILHLKCVFF